MALLKAGEWRARSITAAFDSWNAARVAAASLVSELGLREAQVQVQVVPPPPGDAACVRPEDGLRVTHYLWRTQAAPAAAGAIVGFVGFAGLLAGDGTGFLQTPGAWALTAGMWAMATVGGFLVGGLLGAGWRHHQSARGQPTGGVADAEARIVVRPASRWQYRRALNWLARWGVARLEPA